MQPQRRSALGLIFVAAVSGACADQTSPTAIPAGMTAVAAAAGANNQKVKVKSMQLSANTLRIDGASFTGDVSIGNSGLAIADGVVLRAEITQNAASKRSVDDVPLSCEGEGKLPTGTCSMTFIATASNASSAGPGTLVPGSATFTLHVVQKTDVGETDLATKSVLVNLVGNPSMTVSVAPTNVLIDGAAATATAVIQNPANSLQGVLLQGSVVQGTAPNETRVATGELLVTCGSNAGVLPPGTCTTTIPVAPSNAGFVTGGLVPGAATFELQLVQGNTTIDVQTAAITLISTTPRFAQTTVASTTLAIGASNISFTADIQNGGPPRSNVIVIASIQQFTSGVPVQKLAGGLAVSCGGAPGDLPTTGNGVCANQGTFNVPDDAGGTGALIPGAATLILQLVDGVGNLDIARFAVTLTTGVTITGVRISPTIPLASDASPYTAFIENTGASQSNVQIQNWITQGTTRRAAGGRTIQCGTGPVGVLPSGSCSVPAFVVAMNDPASGTGILVPGPATLEIELNTSGAGATTLARTTVPITLVISGPTIINIALSATDMVAGQEVTYDVTFYNPTSSTIPGVGIQGLLSQGTIVDFGTGGFTVQCPGAALGDLPPGACTMPGMTLNTRNIDGIPLWQLGPATWRLELSGGTTVLNSQTRTINFIGLQ